MFLRIVSVCSLLVLLFAANITGEETKTPEDYFFEKNPELRLKYNLYPTSFDFVIKHAKLKYTTSLGIINRMVVEFYEDAEVRVYLDKEQNFLHDDRDKIVAIMKDLKTRFSVEEGCHLYWFEYREKGERPELGLLVLKNGEIVFREVYI